MLTGVYRPTDGTILLDGKSLVGKKPAEICQEGVARTFQNIRLFTQMSVLDNEKWLFTTASDIIWRQAFSICLPIFQRKRRWDEEALKILKIFELDTYANTNASNLPYGKQRKLEIARALATNPKMLLLDEPAAGMNPNETKELMETIELIRKEFKVTILLIEHDMKLVSGICEYLYVLNFGTELAHGTPAEVLNDPKVVKAYLGE